MNIASSSTLSGEILKSRFIFQRTTIAAMTELSGPSFQLAIFTLLIFTVNGQRGNQDDEGPKVLWQGLPPALSVKNSDLNAKLMITNNQQLDKHYSNLDLDLFNYDLFNHLVSNSSIKGTPVSKETEVAILKEFRSETIKRLTTDDYIADCGVRIEDGKLKLMHCPGLVTVITLVSAETMNCRKADGLSVFGPVLVKSVRCRQQLLSLPSCVEAARVGYLKDGCSVQSIPQSVIVMLSALVSLNVILWIMILSTIVFIKRTFKWSGEHKTTIKASGLELEQFVTYDSIEGTLTYKEKPKDLKNVSRVVKQVKWSTLLLSIFCFRAVDVNAYDLMETQIISDHQYKYTISLAMNEMIRVGSMEIRFASSSMEARLTHSFITFKWDLNKFDTYYCQQSNCDSKMICREDIMQFSKMNSNIRREFGLDDNDFAFATCKNMRGYCMFGNGCFIIGMSLVLHKDNRFEVYSISQQEQVDSEIVLPPGCYLDSHEKSKKTSMEGMFYVEDAGKNGWFCHPTLYSHYPLPNTLGDLKLGENGEINFITDQIHCATDTWRDVYCLHPISFIKTIDKHCIRNTPDLIGYKVVRDGDSLTWRMPSEEVIRITCDRDLKLHVSEDHCQDPEIHVWDTRNSLNDLMITVRVQSTSGKGLFKFPKSIHMESHIFPCDGLQHNTLLFDLKSLNSSGLKYNYHTNIKDIQPEILEQGAAISVDGNNWFVDEVAGWAGSSIHWFTGISMSTILALGLVALCLFRRTIKNEEKQNNKIKIISIETFSKTIHTNKCKNISKNSDLRKTKHIIDDEPKPVQVV